MEIDFPVRVDDVDTDVIFCLVEITKIKTIRLGASSVNRYYFSAVGFGRKKHVFIEVFSRYKRI